MIRHLAPQDNKCISFHIISSSRVFNVSDTQQVVSVKLWCLFKSYAIRLVDNYIQFTITDIQSRKIITTMIANNTQFLSLTMGLILFVVHRNRKCCRSKSSKELAPAVWVTNDYFKVCKSIYSSLVMCGIPTLSLWQGSGVGTKKKYNTLTLVQVHYFDSIFSV